MNLFDIKIENIEFTAAGEAYVVIKAIRDAYAWAERSAEKAGDLPKIAERSKERIAYFNGLLAEAEDLIRQEERIFEVTERKPGKRRRVASGVAEIRA